MATYKHRFTPATGNEPDVSLFHVVERPLYGSARLGVDAQEVDLAVAAPVTPTTAHPGQWRYELTDHLGNACPELGRRVQVVVTEELLGLDANNDESVDQWAPVLLSAQDYEAFGSLLPGRNYSSSSYRFGFGGQEKDDEINGANGTSYTAEFWQYDPRVGRRWNLDPIHKPHESQYACYANNPVWFIDPSGADTSLTASSRSLVLDLLNPESKNFNEAFATNFQTLVDDKSTVYTFDQWDQGKQTRNKDGSAQTQYGVFTGHGKNEAGQNLVTIGYSLQSTSQGHPLDALFEEFDHAHQFLNQRIGFSDLGEGWQTLAYDFYDEVDNKISRVRYLSRFLEGSTYKTQLFGTNSKIVRANFDRAAAARTVGLNYEFEDREERSVFDVFSDPSKIKEQFKSGMRWDNVLIGGN